MSVRPLRGRRWQVIAAAASATLIAAAGAWFATGNASAGTISGSLYVDPNSQAAKWVSANPNDSRASVIKTKIASQSAAQWFANYNPSAVQSQVSALMSAAAGKGQIPVMAVYQIPNRDCGGASAGGAPDMNSYQNWISAFSKGLGNQTSIIILETDSIALQTCVSGSSLSDRNNALSQATRTIKSANSNAKVYLDGGHSAWNSASEQAQRLVNAGIQYADGFYTNVSNFQPTSNEANYGRSIISALQGKGVSGKHHIIDTSRNGGAAGDWCADDNNDRRIGQYPTLNTGDSNIDGYLWIKPPGEADGCKYTAGSFQPDLAYSLAQNAPNPTQHATESTTSSSSSSSASSSSSSSSASSSSSSGGTQGAGCSATFQTTGSWQGGFQAQVTVKAGNSAINGWAVSWTLASGQSISQAWNADLSVSGSVVSLKNISWNGSLAANASTSFGLIGSGSTASPTVSCTAS